MSYVGTSPWDNTADAKLRKLWDAGRSTSDIAAAMGMTRNQVIGRAHRLRLVPRPSPILARGSRPARANAGVPQASSTITRPVGRPGSVVRAPAIESDRGMQAEAAAAVSRRSFAGPLTLDAPFASALPPHQEPRDCRFPIGPGGTDWRFCQQVQQAGSPYCAAHHVVAYRRFEVAR